VVGQEARPRQLDHGADEEVLAVDHRGVLGAAQDEPAGQLELALVVDERDHDLQVRLVARAVVDGVGGGEDRPDLHLVDLGVQDPEAHPAGAEHRVGLLQGARPVALGALLHVARMREELVQRRVEQPDGHGQAGHRLEQPLEVGLLERAQLLQALAARRLVPGEDDVGHERLALARGTCAPSGTARSPPPRTRAP
jgi:hypothetical protein